MAAMADFSVNGSNEPTTPLPSLETSEIASKPKKRGRKSKAELEEIAARLTSFVDDNDDPDSVNDESDVKDESENSSSNSGIIRNRRRGRPKVDQYGSFNYDNSFDFGFSGSEGYPALEDSALHRRKRGRPKVTSLAASVFLSSSSGASRKRGRPKANLDQISDLIFPKKRGRKRSNLTSQGIPKKRGRPPKQLNLAEMKPPVELIPGVPSTSIPLSPESDRFLANGGETTLDMVVTGLQDIAENVKAIQVQVGRILNYAEQYMGTNGNHR